MRDQCRIMFAVVNPIFNTPYHCNTASISHVYSKSSAGNILYFLFLIFLHFLIKNIFLPLDKLKTLSKIVHNELQAVKEAAPHAMTATPCTVSTAMCTMSAALHTSGAYLHLLNQPTSTVIKITFLKPSLHDSPFCEIFLHIGGLQDPP